MKHFIQFFLPILLFPTLIFGQTPSTIIRTFPVSKGNAEKIQPLAANEYLVHGKAFGYGYLAVLDETGTELIYNSLKDEIGGIRSEITDAVISQNFIYFIGDCDSCGLAGDPERKIVYLKTDKNLNVIKKQIIDPPTDSVKAYIVWGYQELRQDGNDRLISLIQLTYEENDTTYTDFSLTQIDNELNVQFQTAYDYHRLDNISDIVVTNDAYYVLTWGISGFFLTADTSRLMRFNKTYTPPAVTTEPVRIWERSYRGIGFKALRMPSGDWVIGGTNTEQFLMGEGPQSMLLHTDGATGAIKNKKLFGGDQHLIDGVRDLKLLANGDILAAVVENANYPDTIFIPDFIYRLYAYPDTWTEPKTGKIMRFNANTLVEAASSTVHFPNADTSDVILRSVWPLNADGSQFVACGQHRRMPVFFTRAVVTTVISGDEPQVAVESVSPGGGEIFENENEEEVKEEEEIVMGLFPNPARSDQFININLETDVSKIEDVRVEVFNTLGKLIYSGGSSTNQFEFPAPIENGVYFAMIRAGNAVLKSKKFLIIE